MIDQESLYWLILWKVITIQVLNEIYLPALIAAAEERRRRRWQRVPYKSIWVSANIISRPRKHYMSSSDGSSANHLSPYWHNFTSPASLLLGQYCCWIRWKYDCNSYRFCAVPRNNELMYYIKNLDSGAAPGMEGRLPRIQGSAAYDTTDIPFPRFYVNQLGSIMNDQESPYPSILWKVIMIQVLNETISRPLSPLRRWRAVAANRRR